MPSKLKNPQSQSQLQPPSLPQSFILKKSQILAHLSTPASSYSDKSPKGSIDAGIRELIDEINAYDGFVTTSSCAGRISVFLEGKGDRTGGEEDGERLSRGGDGDEDRDGNGNDREEEEGSTRKRRSPVPSIRNLKSKTTTAPGGKGGGKFLFVSHEPLEIAETYDDDVAHSLFGQTTAGGQHGEERLSNGETVNESTTYPHASSPSSLRIHELDSLPRLVRFAFEPMILHILSATLSHACPLLAAAINAGFRESGVQSLRSLEDPRSCPMVAVRTAGLGVESVIGALQGREGGGDGGGDGDGDGDGLRDVEYLVSRDYRLMLLRLANQRFKANEERIARFRGCLREAMAMAMEGRGKGLGWEDPVERGKRKRREGLERRERQKGMEAQEGRVQVEEKKTREETRERLNGGRLSKTLGYVSDDPRLDEDELGGIGIPDVRLFTSR